MMPTLSGFPMPEDYSDEYHIEQIEEYIKKTSILLPDRYFKDDCNPTDNLLNSLRTIKQKLLIIGG